VTAAAYYDLIEDTFDRVESLLEALEDDPDISVAEGVINVKFSNGVVFVFSRQPPTEQLWLATPEAVFTISGMIRRGIGSTPKPRNLFEMYWCLS
jgi:frataxin-like iron-binding protein CyaY